MSALPPLSTRERAAALSRAAASFPHLGPTSEETLLTLVAQELGHPEVLDRFVSLAPSQNRLAKASALSPLLHIISGNTPHAGLQTLMRGLLLGAHNRCKLPGNAPLPEIADFIALLPPPLQALVETARELPPHWVKEAGALIVFGTDATIAHFHSLRRPEQRLIPHGHKISLGIILEGSVASAPLAARDIALYNQSGCLSPQLLYVRGEAHARRYAQALAAALQEEEVRQPRGPVPLEVGASITHFRDEYRFRSATNPEIALWESPDSTAWSVAYDPTPSLHLPPLFRSIIVKPLSEALPPAQALEEALHDIIPHLSTIGLHPYSHSTASELALALKAPRLCPLGSMQTPPPYWHHDGLPLLQPLVSWSDLE